MKSVIVTGGTRRLGKFIADRLRADGWRVITTSSRPESAADIVVDLSTSDGADKLFSSAVSMLGGNLPDALVNNAALFVGDDSVVRQLNFDSPRRLIELMAERDIGCGKVVNVLDARVLKPGFSSRPAHRAYDESKLSLHAFSLDANRRFAPRLYVDFVAPDEVLPPEGFHLRAELPPDERSTPESVAEAVAQCLGQD